MGHRLEWQEQRQQQEQFPLHSSKDTNCFEIRNSDGLNLRSMYRVACLISHECTPNTKHTFGKEYDINIYATRKIKVRWEVCLFAIFFEKYLLCYAKLNLPDFDKKNKNLLLFFVSKNFAVQRCPLFLNFIA